MSQVKAYKFDPKQVIVPKGLSIAVAKTNDSNAIAFWLLLKRKSKHSNFKGWRKQKRVELCQSVGVSYSLFCVHVNRLKELGLCWEDENKTLYLLGMAKAKKLFIKMGFNIAHRQVRHEEFEGDYKQFKKLVQQIAVLEYLEKVQYCIKSTRTKVQGKINDSKFARRGSKTGLMWLGVSSKSISRAIGKKSASSALLAVEQLRRDNKISVLPTKPIFLGTHHKMFSDNELFSSNEIISFKRARISKNFEKKSPNTCIYKNKNTDERVFRIIYTKKGIYAVTTNQYKIV